MKWIHTLIKRKQINKIKYKYVFIHASYQINIGSEPILLNDTLYNPGLDIFITEIKNSLGDLSFISWMVWDLTGSMVLLNPNLGQT